MDLTEVRPRGCASGVEAMFYERASMSVTLDTEIFDEADVRPHAFAETMRWIELTARTVPANMSAINRNAHTRLCFGVPHVVYLTEASSGIGVQDFRSTGTTAPAHRCSLRRCATGSGENFVKALTWHGKGDIRCETVPDPKIEHGRDAIIKVTACAICGSDLHIFDGVIPTMKSGDVLGHETMGEVVEVGADNKKLKVGDRVVVPFTISCGECFFCKRGFFSGCERSNPNAKKAEKLWGHSPAGLFGYSHLLGGYSGGQAEYLRVPYADVGPIKVPDGFTDEQVLFLSDIFPTGYMARRFLQHQRRRHDRDLGLRAGRAVRHPQRLPARRRAGDRDRHRAGAAGAGARRGADHDRFHEGGYLRPHPGADPRPRRRRLHRCRRHRAGHRRRASIRCVDRVKVATFMGTDRPHVLRQAIHCCRNFGTVSIVGVYGGFVDKIPMGSAINRGLTFRMAQTPVQHYLPKLLKRIENGEIDPSFVITHRAELSRKAPSCTRRSATSRTAASRSS